MKKSPSRSADQTQISISMGKKDLRRIDELVANSKYNSRSKFIVGYILSENNISNKKGLSITGKIPSIGVLITFASELTSQGIITEIASMTHNTTDNGSLNFSITGKQDDPSKMFEISTLLSKYFVTLDSIQWFSLSIE